MVGLAQPGEAVGRVSPFLPLLLAHEPRPRLQCSVIPAGTCAVMREGRPRGLQLAGKGLAQDPQSPDLTLTLSLWSHPTASGTSTCRTRSKAALNCNLTVVSITFEGGSEESAGG